MKHPFLIPLRKALALTTVLLLLVGLTGCLKNDKPDSTDDSQIPPVSSSTPPAESTQAPPAPSTEAAPAETDPPATEAPTIAPTQAPATEPPATEPPKESVTATVTAVKLNIRKEAGTQYEYVGSYAKNEQIEILETKGDWGRTDKGWVYLDYVEMDQNPEQTQTEAPNTDSTDDSNTTVMGHGVVTLDILNVRSGPGTNYEKVGTVKRGSRYTYYEKNNGWVRINDGWISVSYFYLEGTTGEGAGSGTIHTADVNIRSGPGLEFDKVGAYSRGDTVKILAQINKWGYTEKGWVSMSYVGMKQHATGMGTVTPETLNIRKQAMVESEQVGTYAKGDRVEILETLGDWGRTDQGWVHLDYIQMDAAARTISEPTARTAATTGKGTVTAEGLNIRKDADLKSDSIGSYNKGDKVDILEVKNGWGRTDKGWIYLEYVKMDR